MKINLRKRRKAKNPEQAMTEHFDEQLLSYMKRDELIDILQGIRDKEKKRRLWMSLPKSTRKQLVRYIKAKKGEQDGKK